MLRPAGEVGAGETIAKQLGERVVVSGDQRRVLRLVVRDHLVLG